MIAYDDQPINLKGKKISMKIPSAFMLYGQRIVVRWRTDLVDDEDKTGQAVFRRNVIELQSNTGGIQRPQTQIESSFFHELVHYVLFMLNKDDMVSDEEFVDGVARLLHQALTTAEYRQDGCGLVDPGLVSASSGIDSGRIKPGPVVLVSVDRSCGTAISERGSLSGIDGDRVKSGGVE